MDAAGRTDDNPRVYGRGTDRGCRIRYRLAHGTGECAGGYRPERYTGDGTETRAGGYHDHDACPGGADLFRDLPHRGHTLPRFRGAVDTLCGSYGYQGGTYRGGCLDAACLALCAGQAGYCARFPLPCAGCRGVERSACRKGRDGGRDFPGLFVGPGAPDDLRGGGLFRRGTLRRGDGDDRSGGAARERRFRGVV